MNTEFIAKTRCGETAHFGRVPPCHEVQNGPHRPPFILLGYLRKDEPELWTASGRWLEDGTPHRHDLLLNG